MRVEVTADIFTWPPITAAGTTYRVVSPLALYQIRQTINNLGIMGPPRPKDLSTQTELRTRFLVNFTPTELEPKITPLLA